MYVRHPCLGWDLVVAPASDQQVMDTTADTCHPLLLPALLLTGRDLFWTRLLFAFMNCT